jgi:hypothetical protein
MVFTITKMCIVLSAFFFNLNKKSDHMAEGLSEK